MKIIFPLVALFLLSSCGQEKSEDIPIDISMTSIEWFGPADQSPVLSRKLKLTQECLRSYGFPDRKGTPPVLIVKDKFACGPYPQIDACFTGSVIVFDAIYYESNELNITGRDAFKHEAIHWDTGLGNEVHDQPFFQACERYEYVPGENPW